MVLRIILTDGLRQGSVLSKSAVVPSGSELSVEWVWCLQAKQKKARHGSSCAPIRTRRWQACWGHPQYTLQRGRWPLCQPASPNLTVQVALFNFKPQFKIRKPHIKNEIRTTCWWIRQNTVWNQSYNTVAYRFKRFCACKTSSDLKTGSYPAFTGSLSLSTERDTVGIQQRLLSQHMKDWLDYPGRVTNSSLCGNRTSPGSFQPSFFSVYFRETETAVWGGGEVGSEAEGTEVLGSGAMSPKGPLYQLRHRDRSLCLSAGDFWDTVDKSCLRKTFLTHNSRYMWEEVCICETTRRGMPRRQTLGFWAVCLHILQ